MNQAEFWNYFDTFANPQLAHRANSFKYAFQHLSQLNRPVCIVEAGCVRNAGTFAGADQSTVLFDNFCQSMAGTVVHSVDISAQSTDMCKSLVSNRVNVHTMDSMLFFKKPLPHHDCPVPAH